MKFLRISERGGRLAGEQSQASPSPTFFCRRRCKHPSGCEATLPLRRGSLRDFRRGREPTLLFLPPEASKNFSLSFC